MMRLVRHLAPKRDGLAPLMVCMFIIQHLPSVARIFRDPQERKFCALSGPGRCQKRVRRRTRHIALALPVTSS
jgi:hypothetical protein